MQDDEGAPWRAGLYINQAPPGAKPIWVLFFATSKTYPEKWDALDEVGELFQDVKIRTDEIE